MHSPVSTASADQLIEELKRELKEAHRRETATAEILRIISSSPTNMRAVLDMVAASAARLCDAHDATIHQVDAGLLRLVAHHGPILTGPTMPMVRGALIGRAILERRGIQVADLPAERTEYPEGSDSARRLGFRTTLAVPLIHVDEAIGAIAIRRTEVRPFTDRQLELLKTFADQAVIAIENARLFEEVQARTRELTEALDYQTATNEVLGVISHSPSDVQPVFDTIVRNSVTLCKGLFSALFQFDGELIHQVAHHNFSRAALKAQFEVYPAPPSRGPGSCPGDLGLRGCSHTRQRTGSGVQASVRGSRDWLAKWHIRPNAQGRRSNRGDYGRTHRAGGVRRQRDRTVENLRRPGCHRH